MTINPTPEQVAILDAASNAKASLMITAMAGTGKTTTLELISKALPNEPALALAFNVPIKKALEKRLPSNWTVKTLNGLGHVAFGRAIGKRLTVDERKLGRLLTVQIKAHNFPSSKEQWDTMRRLVTSAMQAGLVPNEWPRPKGLVEDTHQVWQDLDDTLTAKPLMIEVARATLIASIKEGFAGLVSYDDQVYLSAIFNGVFPRYNLVMVDESQDLSPLNHIQIKRSAAGRLIVVGDPRQAIYSWRGADAKSMGSLRELRSDWLDLPLNTTFRCPKAIVTRQQDHAPGFTAFHANAEGEVQIIPKGTPWDPTALPQGTAVLCRNNAPLLALAFRLLRNGIGCHMVGRDIGKGLVALANKLCPLDSTPKSDCQALIARWLDTETALALANAKPSKAEQAEDWAQCLLAVLDSDGVADARGLRVALESLFARDQGKVTLSTIHRAKGLEWPTVLHLDPWRIPSRWAKGEALVQEANLKYVTETRAMHTLILANLKDLAL